MYKTKPASCLVRRTGGGTFKAERHHFCVLLIFRLQPSLLLPSFLFNRFSNRHSGMLLLPSFTLQKHLHILLSTVKYLCVFSLKLSHIFSLYRAKIQFLFMKVHIFFGPIKPPFAEISIFRSFGLSSICAPFYVYM